LATAFSESALAGAHTLAVTIDLGDGGNVSDTVTRQALENTEP
jgi:hypothetical protein